MAKKQIPETITYKMPPTSYAVATADYILQDFGVNLKSDEIRQLLQENNSFYKELLGLMSLKVYNSHVITQCGDLKFFCQEELVGVIFAKYNLASQYGGRPVLSALKEETLDQLHNQLDHLNANLTATKNTQTQLINQYESWCADKVTQWQNLLAKPATKAELAAFIQHFREESATPAKQFAQLQAPLEKSFHSFMELKSRVNEFQQSFDRTILEHIEKQPKYAEDMDTISETLISGPQLGK